MLRGARAESYSAISGDRRGRKTVLVVTLGIMGVFTCPVGLLRTRAATSCQRQTQYP